MKFQQTSKSAHGAHGPRAEGRQLPTPDEIVRRVGRDRIDELAEERHPGLQEILLLLKGMMGVGSLAVVNMPKDKIANAAAHGGELEEIAFDVRVTATTFKSVQVLHKILALGLEAALDEESNAVCYHCDEVLFFRDPTPQADAAWLHLETGRIRCPDGGHVARKRRRPRRTAD